MITIVVYVTDIVFITTTIYSCMYNKIFVIIGYNGLIATAVTVSIIIIFSGINFFRSYKSPRFINRQSNESTSCFSISLAS